MPSLFLSPFVVQRGRELTRLLLGLVQLPRWELIFSNFINFVVWKGLPSFPNFKDEVLMSKLSPEFTRLVGPFPLIYSLLYKKIY
jgi:hypothetical protein